MRPKIDKGTWRETEIRNLWKTQTPMNSQISWQRPSHPKRTSWTQNHCLMGKLQLIWKEQFLSCRIFAFGPIGCSHLKTAFLQSESAIKCSVWLLRKWSWTTRKYSEFSFGFLGNQTEREDRWVPGLPQWQYQNPVIVWELGFMLRRDGRKWPQFLQMH